MEGLSVHVAAWWQFFNGFSGYPGREGGGVDRWRQVPPPYYGGHETDGKTDEFGKTETR